MLLGGRPLRIVKHLVTRVSPLKPTFIHHGMPMRVVTTPRILGQQRPTAGDEPPFDTVIAHTFTPPETELLDQEPSHLVELLNNQTSHAEHPTLTNSHVISAYLTLRQSSSSLPNLHAEAYRLISKHAGSAGLQQVMRTLADDVLSHFPRETDPKGFSESIIALLSHATSQCPLSPQRILQLYEALVVSNKGTSPPLSPDIAQHVTTAALMRPSATIPPLETLGRALLSSDPPTEAERTKSTQLAYELLMKVLVEGEESYPGALRLFQDLIEADRIPKRAQARAGEQGGSFRTVIASALVRACLWFEWRRKAADLLMEILRNPNWPREKGVTETDVKVIVGLTLEVLRTLLPSVSEDEIQASRTLILALLPIVSDDTPSSHSPPVELPQDLLFAFYDSCYACQLVAPAARLYHHLQSPQIRQYHDYPPPRNAALFWLLKHFASPGVSPAEERHDLEGHLYIARAMFNDILRRRHPVPPMDRPRLVALAASRGFGLCARKLWEMYTAPGDPDRDIVRGNAHMLVPMVRLFVKAQERWDTNVKKDKLVNTADSASSVPLPRDQRQFAEQVLASYIETKTPLALASQYDLNALARAQLLLGRLPEGVDTLSHIMKRADTPQVTDINVALTGLAHYSPQRAAEIIQYMLEQGVLPSAPTFSLVLHEALQDKDTEVIERLVARARELGYGALTHKGMASLVRSAVTFEYTSDRKERRRQQWNLEWAMNTIETIMRHRSKTGGHSDHVQDHAISVSVGLECVRGSLKALQPERAFQFWKLLVKDRVLWDDREHKDLRAWIARVIRHHWRERQLATNRASSVLEELRAPGVDADGPPKVGRRE